MRKLKQLIEMVVAIVSAGLCILQTLQILPVKLDFQPEQSAPIVLIRA